MEDMTTLLLLDVWIWTLFVMPHVTALNQACVGGQDSQVHGVIGVGPPTLVGVTALMVGVPSCCSVACVMQAWFQLRSNVHVVTIHMGHCATLNRHDGGT